MSIDLSKLSPGPLRFQEPHEHNAFPCVVDANGNLCLLSDMDNVDDLKHAVLSRRAEEIMMRRRWFPCPCDAGWCVLDEDECWPQIGDDKFCNAFADPFTALVEADKWFTEQEKAR